MMNKVDLLKKYIRSLDAYKISNTHFRIGTKVHSSDFFYAKRLFQNSYYTSRIAILLTIKIKEQFNNTLEPLTLIGYELYSELLLSLVKKFLTDFGYKKINHFVTRDLDKNIEHIPAFEKASKNAIIIVPIASTGSTAVKIEEYIKRFYPETNFISKHYNIILATDSNESFSEITNQAKEQISFIKLAVTWQHPSNCIWCFDKSKYRPLFETDKSSLTPALIFGFPLAKKNDGNISVAIDKINFINALIYRKAKRNNEHFLFSTNTDKLINDNMDKILKWLDNVKIKLKIKQVDKIVIIAPCHYSNSLFINLVNEQLFNSSATIIHHQIGVDYLSNFKLLNHRYLNQKGAKIFFVDDSLISGGTYFRIHDLLRYTLDYDDAKKISGSIFLSDKSSPNIHERVFRASNKNIFSFINVNLPTPPRVFGKKPLEHEIKRYADSSQMVLHDVLKKAYLIKSEDLSGNEFFQNKESSQKSLRHEKMFRATHKVYEYFGKSTNMKDVTFDDLLDSIEFEKEKLEDKMVVMKVLSQYPFLLYMPVREKTFTWYKEWFDRAILNYNILLDENKLSYENYQELKFLFRRAVFLGNNSILSEDFFGFISKLLLGISNMLNSSIYKPVENEWSINATIDLFPEQTIIEKKINSLNDFHIYLLKQYVEVIQKNTWCAAKIMESIKQTENSFITSQGKQFIRMLKIELAIVVNDFYSNLNDKNEWHKVYKNGLNRSKRNVEIIIDLENTKILDYLNNNSLLNINEFEITNRTLNLIEDGIVSKQLLNYLWIKQFVNSDQKFNISNISLTDKTDSIFLKSNGLFKDPEKIGTFLIVTDGQNIPHLVYDKDHEGNRKIKVLSEAKHELLLKFLKGENDEHNIDKKTIIEYKKNDQNKWIDIYSLKPDSHQINISFESNWLLLIRISEQEPIIVKDKNDLTYRTLGLLGFYCEDNLEDDLLAKQFLMLLRNDFGKFIKKHHKNDEFSGLREAEIKNRYAYLAGHGRQMIQKLAKYNTNIFGDVVSTMEKLQYLFATRWISDIGNTAKIKGNLNNTLIRLSFPNTKVNKSILEEIVEIGNEVYNTEIIENKVDLNAVLKLKTIDESFSFKFDGDILKFICFELFINAKKNRFHFIGDTCSICQSDKNSLEVNFKIDINNKLRIELIGTGVSVPISVKNEINDGTAAMKPEHEIAGLNLIYKIIKILNDKNQLSINKENVVSSCPECGIQNNIVVLELYPIDND